VVGNGAFMTKSKVRNLYGLVLSGGKSTRMGTDKSMIAYHGTPQREYMYNLLDQVCERTFLSVRNDQLEEVPQHLNTILDRNEYKGPYNGILSAHKTHPNVSWLVFACDIPLMNLESIEQLLLERDTTKMASAFATRTSGLPEPLAAIWEPTALKTSIRYLEKGTNTCPRKFLINEKDVALIFPKQEQVLVNANSKVEYEMVLNELNSN